MQPGKPPTRPHVSPVLPSTVNAVDNPPTATMNNDPLPTERFQLVGTCVPRFAVFVNRLRMKYRSLLWLPMSIIEATWANLFRRPWKLPPSLLAGADNQDLGQQPGEVGWPLSPTHLWGVQLDWVVFLIAGSLSASPFHYPSLKPSHSVLRTLSWALLTGVLGLVASWRAALRFWARKPVPFPGLLQPLQPLQTPAFRMLATAGKASRKAKDQAPVLVIVESPAKAATISKYLGSTYVVKSSVGVCTCKHLPHCLVILGPLVVVATQ